MHKIITTIILLCTFASVYAQNDPTLAALVAVYTNQAEKELKNQETVMLLQTTGHVWLRDETEATTKLQREFNDYLDTFRSVIVYAAEVYGFYHETAGLIDNTSDLISLTEAHPSNSLAVALSARRNTLYRQIITGGLDIVNDIRTVCLSGSKMTETERMAIVFGIRPKLKTLNTTMRRLERAVKYTTMNDIWYEIDENARPQPANKRDIAEAAARRWKQAGKDVRP